MARQERPWFARTALLAALLLAGAWPAGAQTPIITWTVTSTADDGSEGTLRWALLQAADGDTITFDLGGPATIHVSANDPLTVNKSVAIVGPGREWLTISGDKANQVFIVGGNLLGKTGSPTVSMSGLTIADGWASDSGGGILNGGTLTITDCAFTGNSASYGGAIANGATMTLGDCTLSSNTATDGGGAIFSGASPWNQVSDTMMTVSRCILTGNRVTELGWGPGGGAITNFAHATSASLTLEDSYLSGNSAQIGGALFNWSKGVESSGVVVPGHATMSVIRSTLTVNVTVMTGEMAMGGAIMQLTESGPDTYARLTVDGSTLSGNTAGASTHAAGGAIVGYHLSHGSIILENSTFVGNSAAFVWNAPNPLSAFGGGVVLSGGELRVDNCTFSNNWDDEESSSPARANDIVVGDGAAATIKNTILAGPSWSTTVPNLSAALDSGGGPGTITSAGHNLSTDGGNTFLTGPGDQPNADPKLGDLADNGGPTWTQALLTGSPAINAADSSDSTGAAVTVDQRGAARPYSSDNDIGAFEFGAAAQPVVSINNIPSDAVYGWTYTPTYTMLGSGGYGYVTSDTPDVCTVEWDGSVWFVGTGTCTLTSHVGGGTSDGSGVQQSFNVQASPMPPPLDLGVVPIPRDPGTTYPYNQAASINPTGTLVVGTSSGDSSPPDSSSAWVWQPDGSFTPLTSPDPVYEYSRVYGSSGRAASISRTGQIIGECAPFWHAGQSKACVWEPSGDTWQGTVINPIGYDGSNPININASGQAVGVAWMNSTSISAGFIWDKTNGTRLIQAADLPPGATQFSPRLGISDNGLVAGQGVDENYWFKGGMVWDSASQTTLALLTWRPDAISPSGLVAGADEGPGGGHVFIWNNSSGSPVTTDLGQVPFTPPSGYVLIGEFIYVASVNDRGQVFGGGQACYARDATAEECEGSDLFLFKWDGTKFIDVTPLLPRKLYAGDDALWGMMNAQGQVVMTYNLDDSGVYSALYWGGDPADRIQALPGLGGHRIWAAAINDSGQIVGGATDRSGVEHAVKWQAPTVPMAPVITSAASATFGVGSAGWFMVTTTGTPAPTLSYEGSLPSGVSFDAATGVLTGTPDPGTMSTYPITFKAENSKGEVSQAFTLTVKLTATVTLSNLTQAYTGSPLWPTATTTPAGLSVIWAGAPQTNPGTYGVTATVRDSSYTGSATGQFVIVAISINNIPAGAVYGDSFTPTYIYTGDGKTSVTSSTLDVCALGRGGVVKFVGIGTCTLTAHATAGATSPAVNGAPQSFNVAKAPAAITIKNLPKNAAYGDKFNPTYTFTGDGAKSVTTASADVCKAVNNQLQFVGVGTCTLTAHIAEGAHYLAGDGAPQSFNVGKAETTISIDNIPKGAKKGGSFVPTYKYAGSGATSVTSSTPKVCTVSGGTTVNFLAGGTCTLTAHATEGALYLATDGKAQSFPVAK